MMGHKCRFLILLAASISVAVCIRIPPNPCPSVFQYYKDPQGMIYGEATIPYDNATNIVFSVNASFLGNFNKPKLRLQMVTEINELNDYTKHVIYNIYFPFRDVIPKITAITFNNMVYCSGPGEPVIPGEPGITNVWSQTSLRFYRRDTGFYNPETRPDMSDTDIPVKRPYERPGLPRPTPTVPEPWPTPPSPTPPIISPTIPQPTPPTDDSRLGTKVPLIPTKGQTEPDPIDAELFDIIFTSPTPPPASDVSNDGFKCGVVNNELPSNAIVPLILGGTDIDIGQYPWLVAFFLKKGTKYDYKCSANLISDKHVLTAGRCVQYLNIQFIKTEEIFLVMGTNSLENWNNNVAITRRAERVEVNPAFKKNSQSAHGDLAVITMDRPVHFSKVLSPVCLWKGNTDLYPLTDKMGVIAGFGQDENSKREDLTHVLRAKRADMPIVSQNECLLGPLGFKEVTSDKTFCTKSGDTLTGPCIGDSGAGFFIFMDGAYYLRGIASAISTSNGICDLSNKYSVFCDVAKFLDWIRTSMK